MIDLSQTLRQSDRRLDPEGHLVGLPRWSRTYAKQQAMSEGLPDLDDLHWRVVYRLRGLYRAHGPAPHARSLLRTLAKDCAELGGRRALYEAFPGGPVAQGSRLAGIPAPHDATDLSFGSVM